MTDAPDTPAERSAEYRRLFSGPFVGRERTGGGIRFRFHLEAGVEDWVRDLAGREEACCPFFIFGVERHGDELWWEVSVVDDDMARQVLDQFFCLPDSVAEGNEALQARLADLGLPIRVRQPRR